MTGWSNPAPLDTPFQLEAVSQHLAEVVKRIGRRSLGLLKDPVPTDAGKRRLDEVDSLFALSASIGALAPRLRKYLETIFVIGGQSAKPLFLRGIYFTSALTEGKELNTELAAALGLSEDQLPASKAWERSARISSRTSSCSRCSRKRASAPAPPTPTSWSSPGSASSAAWWWSA